MASCTNYEDPRHAILPIFSPYSCKYFSEHRVHKHPQPFSSLEVKEQILCSTYVHTHMCMYAYIHTHARARVHICTYIHIQNMQYIQNYYNTISVMIAYCGRGNKFFFFGSPKHPDQVWSQPNLLFYGYRGLSPGI